MPAIAAITTADDQVVPRAFVFDPQSISGNLSTYLDQTPLLAAAASKLTASISRPGKNTKNSKVRIRLEIPVMGGVTGDTVISTMAADVTFTVDKLTTLTDRQTLVSVFTKILGVDGTMASVMVEDLKQYY